MKRIIVLILAALLSLSCLALVACSGDEIDPGQSTQPGQSGEIGQTEQPGQTEASTVPGQPTVSTPVVQPGENQNPIPDSMINGYIAFSGTSYTTTNADAIRVDGSSLTIIQPGTYDISGTLENGQICVEVTKADRVTLILNNFTGYNASSAVIWVKSADKVYLEVKNGTTNTLTDGSTYVFANPTDTKPNACIYASDDLSIKGRGTLIVNGNYNNGIGCKNDLSINNVNLTVNAVNNAIKGNGSVTVKGDAKVLVESADDAIKTDSLNEGKGYLLVTENANVTIYCEDDGLQATQNLTITAGATVTTYAKGNSVNCDGIIAIDQGCLFENVVDGEVTEPDASEQETTTAEVTE